jgi:hypothetical protein
MMKDALPLPRQAPESDSALGAQGFEPRTSTVYRKGLLLIPPLKFLLYLPV